MEEITSNTPNYINAVEAIKKAILQAQYQTVKLINRQQLALYYGIGKFISENSRRQLWGSSALESISDSLRKDLPGLRGFSSTNLKLMRIFYEQWKVLDANSSVATDELQSTDNKEVTNSSVTTDEFVSITLPSFADFPIDSFLQIGFTNHCTILTMVKDKDERLFYIEKCALGNMKNDTLKKYISSDAYHHQDALPNNFAKTIPSLELARRAILSFKDEYMLDFINVEELGARDIEDVDERIVENKIVQNIKNFVLKFGDDFSFISNQYEIKVCGHLHVIDLLFYNRELQALVAVELKTGPFKPIYLGQLNMYLQVLDDFVRKPNENPSIGIILCKSAEKSYVEYAIRDYDKPIGVSTFKTASDMPEKLRNALPDIEEMRKVLESE